MHFRNFANLVLLSTALSVQARASASFPKVTAGDFQLIQTTTAAPSRLLANADIPTVPPFVPSADNLIVNTTVPQGEFADLGSSSPPSGTTPTPPCSMGLPSTSPSSTPPRAVSRRSSLGTFIDSGPETPQPVGVGFCGFFPAFFIEGVLDSSVLGTYTGRWIVEFGESTQPDAPVDPNSGCGPEPFNITTVEFVRTWEVVEAA
ncbi:hypothetical protein B0H14DRAFT_3483819 [Mycena olivaceomarginata]|nr:hypothetical protein B0H14DRAFT_3483819 [Mycena olivaceomarginata]